MRDTSREVEQILRAKLRSLGPEARIRMASGMFSAACELSRAGAQAGSAPAAGSREQLLIRLYSADLSPAVIEAVARRMRNNDPPGAQGEAAS